MSDSALPLIKGIITRLKAVSAVTNIVGSGSSARIYSIVPQQTTFPYIKIIVSSEDWSAKDFVGMRHIVRIQGFSREPSIKEVGDIRAAVISALERQEANITVTGYTLVRLDKSALSDIITNEDGETQQSIIEFEAITQ